MPIEFACPNGHKLRVADNQAGKTVKCPRCAAVAKVPAANGAAEQEPVAVLSGSGGQPVLKAGGSGITKAGSTEVKEARDSASSLFDELGLGRALAAGSDKPAGGSDKIAGGSGKLAVASDKPPGGSDKQAIKSDKPAAPSDPGDEVLVFLCPNGHKLNSKRRLQGHVGQCPHCGAKFRIPMWDEGKPEGEGVDLGGFHIPADPVAGDNRGVEIYDLSDVIPPANAAKPTTPATGTAPAGATAPGTAAGTTTPATAAVVTTTPAAAPSATDAAAGLHPLAQLVNRLWAEREHGGIIELHLEGGVMIVPEWFEKSLSQHSHGLFAVLSADGTVTMTIVPWDSVARVIVRGVVGLPDGMFE